MENDIEVFERKGERFKKPYISILKCGYITINKSAILNFGLDEYSYVSLQYSKDSNIFTINFSDELKRGKSYTITKRRTSYRLNCKSALKYFNIDHPETVKYYNISVIEYSKWSKSKSISINLKEVN